MLFQKMSTYIAACEELLKQRGDRMMANGIAYFRSAHANNQSRDLKFLAPLKSSCSLKGPVPISFNETNIFKIGREHSCNLVLPEDMFEEDENRKHDKD